MQRLHNAAYVAACIVALSCDRRSDVQQQTEELREAQTRVGSETSRIENDLSQAKAEVVRLEKELALAREGITEDVLHERQDLKESLATKQQEVKGEINEARREAQTHDRDVQQAARELDRTQPPARVESKVSTQTEVTERPRTQVETIERREVIPVRGTTTTLAVDAGTDDPSLNPDLP